MILTVLTAIFGTAAAALPLLRSGRRSLLNPALGFFAIVVWSLLLETLYIATFRDSPGSFGYDRIYVDASSSDFLLGGALLIAVASLAYSAGFFGLAGRRLSSCPRAPLRSPKRSRVILGCLLALFAAAVVAYLYASGDGFELSTRKRFYHGAIGVASRFHYGPYYPFKLALCSASAAFAAALLYFRAPGRAREKAIDGALLSLLFLLALGLSHFASLRLFIVLLVLQIALLFHRFGSKRHGLLVTALGLLTLASFAWITFLGRPTATAPGRGAEGAARGQGPRPAIVEVYLQRLFDGRYLMDVAKVAQLVRHFPARSPYLLGEGFLGSPPSRAPDSRPEDGTFHRYLSRTVFEQPHNSIPAGFAGEMYVNFGHLGVILGFAALGGLHRLIFNHLDAADPPVAIAACTIALIPTTTVLLLNSGVVSTVARAVQDVVIVMLVWSTWRPRQPTAGSSHAERESDDAAQRDLSGQATRARR